MLFKVAGWWGGRERTDGSGFGGGIDTRGGEKKWAHLGDVDVSFD